MRQRLQALTDAFLHQAVIAAWGRIVFGHLHAGAGACPQFCTLSPYLKRGGIGGITSNL